MNHSTVQHHVAASRGSQPRTRVGSRQNDWNTAPQVLESYSSTSPVVALTTSSTVCWDDFAFHVRNHSDIAHAVALGAIHEEARAKENGDMITGRTIVNLTN